MANILLLETATEVCATAITAGGKVVASVHEDRVRSHAAVLTLQIAQCVRDAGLRLADLDAVAVSSGPGSYTSLRVGASVAQGLCYTLDKPLIALNTLLTLADALRQNSNTAQYFMPMLDARRQEVWTALYDRDLRCRIEAQPINFENNLFYKNEVFSSVFDFEKSLILGGNGMLKAKDVVFFEKAVRSSIEICSAHYMADLANEKYQNADFQDLIHFKPFYMKPPNITISKMSNI
jgi:tRNA threonylcarbamoyladenosine biosynthesis protein TsaB